MGNGKSEELASLQTAAFLHRLRKLLSRLPAESSPRHTLPTLMPEKEKHLVGHTACPPQKARAEESISLALSI